MKKLKHITEVCKEAYEQGGKSAVLALVDKQSDGIKQRITESFCNGCADILPHYQGSECLVCGQITK